MDKQINDEDYTLCKVKACKQYIVFCSDYCRLHTCNEGGCSLRTRSILYCKNHGCNSKGCTYDYWNYSAGKYCPDHRCNDLECQLENVYGSKYCLSHICNFDDCKNKRSYFGGRYCESHQKQIRFAIVAMMTKMKITRDIRILVYDTLVNALRSN
jgi:hypothetical protein